MLAAKAMPMGSAPASPSVSPSGDPPLARTAIAVGIMMSAVEVLDISMERIAAVIMKASNTPACPRWPAILNSASASRLCSPVRSMASAMKAPPRIRKRMGE